MRVCEVHLAKRKARKSESENENENERRRNPNPSPSPSMESSKSNKITDIVRLRLILRKWRKLANSSSKISIARSSSIKFLKRTLSLSDTTARDAPDNTVPKGYLAVCVGEEQKRFVISTEHLGHPAFRVLLRAAEEEFGFQQAGILRITCEVAVFERIMKVVEEKKEKFSLQECRFDAEMLHGSGMQQTPPHHPHSTMCR